MAATLLEALLDLFGTAQQALFESAVQPLLFGLGMGHVLEEAYRATGWFLVGVVQIVLLLTVVGALERWRPVEPVSDAAAVRTDRLYTLIHRLGLFRLAMYFTLEPLVLAGVAQLRLLGWQPWQADALWPGVTDTPVASFLLYLVLFDLVDYGVHRAQHGWAWWWQLHALHHSQRQMTMWTDSRNHLLDDVLRDGVFALVALTLGVAPGQFVALVAFTQLMENLAHANVRLSFGPVLGRLLVSPAYHRLHHRMGIGHESAGRGTLGGHNFAVLLPLWDHLFRTARHDSTFEPTGIRDQLPGEGARDYGRSFWAQQRLGLLRLFGRA